MTKETGLARFGVRKFAALLAVAVSFGGGTFAGEVWDGNNLTIFGSRDPDVVYEKLMDGETLTAYWVKVGTEAGSARLVMKDSTFTLSNIFYLGTEADPGYTNLTATLVMTNSTLTCTTLQLGNNMTGKRSDAVVAVIGPGSVITCNNYKNYGQPTPRLRFTGGRMVFDGNATYLGDLQGHTWKGAWPNEGVQMVGEGAPIDLEVRNTRKLAGGWAIRDFYLRGNGGLVKRGAGKLIWGWFTYGSNDGYMEGDANYTGDTVIKAGGIELATPSSVAKNQIRYFTPAGSALKIEEGAYFDFAGNPASFLGVSGAGTLTNSSETAATLTLGSGGGDGEFSPALLGGALNLVKAGTGTLTVAVARLDGNLYASNGTVKVSSGTPFRVNEIHVAPNATLDVRGAHVECDLLSAPRSAFVLWDADTVFDCAVDMDEDGWCAAGRYGFKGALRKTGDGTLTLFGSCAKASGTVAIEDGTVVCTPAPAWSGKYFIINFYGDVHKDTHDGVAISEFILYGADGNRVNQGAYSYTPLPAAETQQYGNFGGIDDATQLAQCEVAVWMPNHDGYIGPDSSSSPPYLFDGKLSTHFRFTWFWESSNKFVFRLTYSAPEVVGFSFVTDDHPERRPTQWKLWGSDDGVTWTALANNATNTGNEATWTWLTNSTPDTVRTEYAIYPLERLASSSAYAPFGDAEVSVGSGATLDLASAEMSLSKLKVDLDAGAGTITRFTPAEGGTIELTSTSRVAFGRAIPLAVTEMASPANLKSWTVKVNGAVRSDLGVRWNGGVLRVSGGGLSIIFR